MKKITALLLTLALCIGLVPILGTQEVQAATKTQTKVVICSDSPSVKAPSSSSFNFSVNVKRGKNFTVSGWALASAGFDSFTYDIDNHFKGGSLTKVSRTDVRSAYAGYSSYYGFSGTIPTSALSTGAGHIVKIYGNKSGYTPVLLGTYTVCVLPKTMDEAAREELAKYKANPSNYIYNLQKDYSIIGQAWCAAFVSRCAQDTSYVSTTIGKTETWCPSMRQNFINKGKYVSNKQNTTDKLYNIAPGDVVFFIGSAKVKFDNANSYGETYETHHVGVVTKVYRNSANQIYAIDFIDGNCNNTARECKQLSLTFKNADRSDYEIIGFGFTH